MIKKLRTQQIVMDLPTEEADVWIRAALQQVIKNDAYQTVQTIDRVGAVHRQLSSVLQQTVTVVDPFTGIPITLNGATIALALTKAVMHWILENNPDYHENEHGDLIKEN